MMPADLEEHLERTVTVPPAAMAVLAARSARTEGRREAYSGYPPARAPSARASAEEQTAMRLAVIGIWTVAALLFATLAILVK
jgi:hypothetical protein